MVPDKATSGGRTDSYDFSYAGTIYMCSLRCGDAARALSAREGFLSESAPVSVLNGDDGDANGGAEKLSSSPECVGRLGSFVVVADVHKDSVSWISVVGNGGAERVITRGISDASQGGSLFAPMYLGVDVVLEARSLRFITSRASSLDTK